jgi:hypothetical protein
MADVPFQITGHQTGLLAFSWGGHVLPKFMEENAAIQRK